MEIGEKIKARRKELSMTAKRLAEISGLHSSTIIRYESGQTKKIPVAVMESICRALGVDEAYFKDDKETGKVLVPLLGRVAAGLGYLADNVIESYISVDKEEISQASDYIYLKVKGDSMYPIFLENDLVLVKVCDSIDSGSYGVFIIDGEDGVIKKVVYGNDFVELLSVNPLYPPRRFEGKDVLRVRVFGEVKEITRKF
mgnify:CR=1 FL=1